MNDIQSKNEGPPLIKVLEEYNKQNSHKIPVLNKDKKTDPQAVATESPDKIPVNVTENGRIY